MEEKTRVSDLVKMKDKTSFDSESTEESYQDCCEEVSDDEEEDHDEVDGPDDRDSLEFEYEPGISLSSLQFYQTCQCQLESESDLQLAAELGKTLLERNKELEMSLKHQQSVIDDQSLEIEYLTKQTASLRDMNESRMKTYEQLELSMIDLERGNSRLSEESLLDKDKIKTLSSTVRQLELRCEELQRHLDDIVLRRDHNDDTDHTDNDRDVGEEMVERTDVNCQVCDAATAVREELNDDNNNNDDDDDEGRDSPATTGAQESGYGSLGYRDTTDTDDIDNEEEFHTARDKMDPHLDAIYEVEEVIRLTAEISCLRADIERGDHQIKELEEQMSSMISENQHLVSTLEKYRRQSLGHLKQHSVEQEVLASEDVSLGKICARCFKSAESSNISEVFLMMMRTEVLPVVHRSLSATVSRFLQSSPNAPWLDKWLIMVTVATLLLGSLRAFFNMFNNIL